MTTGPIAKRYAGALADAAAEDGVQETVAQELSFLTDLLRQSAELSSVLKNPAISAEEKVSALQKIGAIARKESFSEQTVRFLRLLLQNRRIQLLIPAQQAYQEIVDLRAGVVCATIESCAVLEPEQEQKLKEQLQTLTGSKIRAQFLRNASILGGVVVRIGSTVYDGSARSQLEAVQALLRRETLR